jgi:hypothetical protein
LILIRHNTHVYCNKGILISKLFVIQVKSLAPIEFVDDEEEVHSSGNKEDTTADTEDSACGGKEKVKEAPNTTKKRGGSG